MKFCDRKFIFAFLFFIFIVLSSCIRENNAVSLQQTVPPGDVAVCPLSTVQYTCVADTNLIWRELGSSMTGTYTTASRVNDTAMAGLFKTILTDISGNTLTSTATIDSVRLGDDGRNISCFSTTTKANDKLVEVEGVPLAPSIVAIGDILSSTGSELTVNLTWSSSRCVVVYYVEVTATNTTSITNTTSQYIVLPLQIGVVYSFRVRGADSINRLGEWSDLFVYAPMSLPSPTVTPPTASGLSAAIIESIVIGVITVITVLLFVVVIIPLAAVYYYYKQKPAMRNIREDRIEMIETKDSESDTTGQDATQSGIECTTQVFFQKLPGLNNWKFVYAIALEKHWEAVELYFQNRFHKYKINDVIMTEDLSINVSCVCVGWKEQLELLSVSRTAVEQYNGEGEPPHCEMTIKAISEDVTPSDLSFTVSFKGLQNSLPIEIGKNFEAQNVMECLTQVFFYQLKRNSWKAKIAFFPRKQEHAVKKIFQDANMYSPEKLNFSGGTISFKASDKTDWTVSESDQHQEIDTTKVERYNGDGEPPYCELKLTAISDDSSTPDLWLPVQLIGVRQPKIMTLTRVVVTPEGIPRPMLAATAEPTAANTTYACQVFYQRRGINCWKATLAFFPKDKTDRVREFYQNANFSLTTTDVVFTTSTLVKVGAIVNKENGWNVYPTDRKIIYWSDVEKYTGDDRPPFIVIKIKPVHVSDETGSSADLKQDIILTGVIPNKIVIERALEKSDMTLNYDT